MPGGGMTVDDCYIAGASQSILFGGADSATQSSMPHDIVIMNSTLTKDPAWYAAGYVIKVALEFKACVNCDVHDCILEYAGTSEGQGGYLIDATVRNQDGNAAWSTVTNVTVRSCTGGHAAGIVSILGTDNVHPSGLMDGFSLTNCSFTNIDPTGITGGAGRIYLIR
jgi:hypothetical protein